MQFGGTALAVNVTKRDQWVADVGRLMDEIAAWAARGGWDVHPTTVEREESELGPYDAAALTLGRPGDRLYAVPVARNVAGAEGRVHLEAFPGLTRLALIRRGGEWRLRTEEGVDWPKAWSQQSLVEALDLLARAES